MIDSITKKLIEKIWDRIYEERVASVCADPRPPEGAVEAELDKIVDRLLDES